MTQSENRNLGKNFLLLTFVTLGFLMTCANVQGDSSTITGRYDTASINGGEYIIQNNVWGASTAQSVHIPDLTECVFNVTVSEHNLGGGEVAAYPSAFKGSHWGTTTQGWQSIPIKDLALATYNWSTDSYRPSGVYNVAAEAWFSPSNTTDSGYAGGGELMIWLDSHGMVPAGSQVGTFGNYEVWYAEMAWDYVCYFQTGMNSADIDLLEFIDDALDRGYFNDSWYYHDIEAGFEICSGGEGLMMTSFEAAVLRKEDGGEPPSPQISGYPSLVLLIGTSIGGVVVRKLIKTANKKNGD